MPLIVRTYSPYPGREAVIGGTDYPDYYKERGVDVLLATINKYYYAIVRCLHYFLDYTTHAQKIEHTNSIDEIEHQTVMRAMGYLDMREL